MGEAGFGRQICLNGAAVVKSCSGAYIWGDDAACRVLLASANRSTEGVSPTHVFYNTLSLPVVVHPC